MPNDKKDAQFTGKATPPHLKIMGGVGMAQVAEGKAAEMDEKQQEAYMNGFPTRHEVSNFVAGIINNVMLPDIQALIERNNMAVDAVLQIFQEVLIEKGIVLEDEWKARLNNVLQEMKRNSVLTTDTDIAAGTEANSGSEADGGNENGGEA